MGPSLAAKFQSPEILLYDSEFDSNLQVPRVWALPSVERNLGARKPVVSHFAEDYPSLGVGVISSRRSRVSTSIK